MFKVRQLLDGLGECGGRTKSRAYDLSDSRLTQQFISSAKKRKTGFLPRADILGISCFQLSATVLTSKLSAKVFDSDAKRSTASRTLLYIISWFTHIHISMLSLSSVSMVTHHYGDSNKGYGATDEM